MSAILKELHGVPGVQRIVEQVRARKECHVRGPLRSGAAAVAATILEAAGTPALAVCPGVEYAEEFAEDVNLFAPALACHFPPLDVLPGEGGEPDEVSAKARLNVLSHLVYGSEVQAAQTQLEAAMLGPQQGTRLVVASINALLQPTCSPKELRRGARSVAVGDSLAPEDLVKWLVESGFYSVPQVERSGQYCLRGGILDVFSQGAKQPARIEFFGDEVDSIRHFDRATQLSGDRVKEYRIVALRDAAAEPTAETDNLLSFLPKQALTFMLEPERIWHHAEEIRGSSGPGSGLLETEQLADACAVRMCVVFLGDNGGGSRETIDIAWRERDAFGLDLDSMLVELDRICRTYRRCFLFCITPAEQDRLQGLLRDRNFQSLEKIEFTQGRLNHGVLFPDDGIALIPHQRLFGRYRQRRVLRRAEEGRPIEAGADLRTGDLVVHVQYGIGRFRGMRVLQDGIQKREHLEIEFDENVRVYVPTDRIELVHRYIGIGGRMPHLNPIRGMRWRTAKEKAVRAIEDLAAELLELQAKREVQKGIAHPPDSDWEQQFESEFPYEETEDQLLTIEAVSKDLQSARPMDRLVCGDVGYGKTEVAMRAAFKVVMGGRQVAMLVPTTVLAQQHFNTFSERMADYPLRVEMLSRFLSDKEARDVLEGMASGNVDIVIGTHRLLQKGVSFANLGLVIIDEEQRFGVRHKEKLKKLRATVDLLTLTATPIPRTLHMSLIGLRDISCLQTPPQDRQAIETKVIPFDSDVLRQAVLREMNREGQVFLVHNRVYNIGEVAEAVRRIVPEARVVVAHGQMPEKMLATAMQQFLDGKADVLVATTIIENGLDIPNANTLLVHRADLLGLTEMHQLRGRVGRYIHKAHAYFFTPNDRPVTPEAQKRLAAIRRFWQLGSGLDIALQDLEIRGAGNILGPEQSGHISAVGYSLYYRLLETAVRRAQGMPVREPPVVSVSIGLDSLLPDFYVPEGRQRMALYRQLYRSCSLEDVTQVERQMRDRFGPETPEAQNLLAEARIRILAHAAGIDSIQLRDGRLYFGLRDADAFRTHFRERRDAPRPVGEDLAVLDRGVQSAAPETLAALLQKMLS